MIYNVQQRCESTDLSVNKEVVEEEEVMGGHAPRPIQREGVVPAAPDQTPRGDLHCILWRVENIPCQQSCPSWLLKMLSKVKH